MLDSKASAKTHDHLPHQAGTTARASLYYRRPRNPACMSANSLSLSTPSSATDRPTWPRNSTVDARAKLVGHGPPASGRRDHPGHQVVRHRFQFVVLRSTVGVFGAAACAGRADR